MQTITLILLVFAFVFEAIAAAWMIWGPPTPPQPYGYRLVAAGLACYFLSILLGGVHL